MKYASLVLFLFLLPTSPLTAFVDNDSHPIVPGFERFAESEVIGDVERGMLLLNELNCASCHDSTSTWPVAPKQAPVLTEVGSRILPEYFESFLLDPHATKPGTTMPNVLANKSDQDKQKIAEAISHFLASTGQTTKQNSTAAFVAEGNQLFHSVGCVACHDPQNKDVTIATSIPLGKLEKKYTLPSLTKFISDPMHVRPSGRMPKFNLTPQETQSIASYLLRDVVVESKINFAYYEGSWEKLPNFSDLKPDLIGSASGFEMNVGPRKDDYGIIFSGYWTTTKDAKFKFRIGSDDGSRLIIDGKMIADNDGIHAVTWAEKEVEIQAGVHFVEVEFFEKGGGEELRVEVSGNGLQSAGLESLLRPTKEEPEQDSANPVFKLDLEKAAIGKTYFQSVGCASCHEMQVDDMKLVSTAPTLPSLAELSFEKGCMADENESPSFKLSKTQITSIKAAIEQQRVQKRAEIQPEQLAHEHLLTHNCYACHNRQLADRTIRGGVVDVRGDSEEVFGRKNWFTGTQVEMGDEGQHPPALTSIGSKLKPEWLTKVLTEGVKDRPYMNTRMPMFGEKNLGTLSDDFMKLDKLKDVPRITQTESERDIKTHGRFLAGDDALSCIKCHTFGKYQATGIQAIDLTTMTKRLNKDWFQVYMLKPSRFRRGTRMPESWPSGKSFYPDMLDGDTQKQIDAIWQFLSDGEEAAKPKGLVRAKLELKAVDSPKIYRNFIEGAGPRAIGVGYPEQVNIAFDAELCRLAIIWQENFIDASRHWTGRGQGFEPPLGENILKLPNNVTFSLSRGLAGFAKDKPELRPKFKGYRFDKNRRPIFTYQLGDVTIEDQPIPHIVDGQPMLKRNFRITSGGTQKLYYLAIVADLAEVKDGKVIADNRVTTGFNSDKAKVLDCKDGHAIYEIDLSSGSVELEQSYEW